MNDIIKYSEFCPEIKATIEKLLENLPNNPNDVCICLQSEADKEIADSVIARIPENLTSRVVYISNSTEYGHATRFVAVLDAAKPLNEAFTRLLEHISRYEPIHNNFVVLLTNLANVPSPTESKRNLRIVLNKIGVSTNILTNVDDIVAQIEGMTVAVNDIECAAYAEIKSQILLSLNSKLDDLSKKKGELLKKKDDFHHKKELFATFCNQLPLDMWLTLKKACDENIEKDTKYFASEIMPILNKTIKEADVSKIQYFFAPYINYLWGQFLNQEMETIFMSVKTNLQEQLGGLVSGFEQYFGEDIRIDDFNVDFISSESQPISTGVEYYTDIIKRWIDKIYETIQWYLFGVDLSTGGFASIIAYTVKKIFDPILAKILIYRISDEKIKKNYSEAIYEQFDKNLKSMIKQLKDNLVPAIETNFKDSINAVIEQLNQSIENVEAKLLRAIAGIDATSADTQNKLNLANNN